MALGGFYLDALAPHGEYPETGWGVRAGQETLIDDALGETDPAKAQIKWHAVQEQQAQQGGYLIPANPNYLDAYASHVRGYRLALRTLQ